MGCGDSRVKEAKSACTAFGYAIGSIDPAHSAAATAPCDEINAKNADQTVYDMQQRCIRLASSLQRSVDKNLPSEKTVDSRNSAMEKCNTAARFVRGGA